ncbi:MAG: hypothetical protein JWO96_620 [Candidatus Saccharibacteria bacterium]|nr:hypothetical protein [Candidatus Saccharibacteria bacterium]
MDQDIAVTQKNNRIHALDIIRGLFLIVILINHIEMYPSGFDLFTGRGRLLVSAAEGFFFMSGLLVGMVYRRRLARGMKFIFARMWRRALELYLGSIILTLLFTAGAIYFNDMHIKEGLYDVINWPHIFKETVLMRYGYGWADFLMRFAILMFLAPFGFYIIAKGKWWLLLLLSLVVWAFRGDNFTLGWQIIFALGMLIGYHWYELKDRLQRLSAPAQKIIKRSLVAITLVTFTLSYASVYILSLLNQNLSTLSAGWQGFTLHWNSANAFVWLYSEKWTMGPVRVILFLIWFAVLFMVVDKYISAINKYTRSTVQLLGQNSLFVYIAHAFIVFIFKLFILPGKPLIINLLVTGAALACLIAVTSLYAKLMPKSKIKKTYGAKPGSQSHARQVEAVKS